MIDKTFRVVNDAGVPSTSDKEFFVNIAEVRVVEVPVKAKSPEEAKKLALEVYRNMTAEEFMNKSDYYEGKAESGQILDIEDPNGNVVG